MGELIEPEVFLSKKLESLNPTSTGDNRNGRTEEKIDIEMTAEEKTEKIKKLEENIIAYIQMTFEGFLIGINEATENKTKRLDTFSELGSHLGILENFYLKLKNLDENHPLANILENLRPEKNKYLSELSQNNERAMKEFAQYLEGRK